MGFNKGGKFFGLGKGKKKSKGKNILDIGEDTMNLKLDGSQ